MFTPQAHASRAQVCAPRRAKRYLSAARLSPAAPALRPRDLSVPAPLPRSPPPSPLRSAAIVPGFPFLQLLARQLHPLHLPQWTEEGINHIFEEDTLLFISLTRAAMGRPGRLTAHRLVRLHMILLHCLRLPSPLTGCSTVAPCLFNRSEWVPFFFCSCGGGCVHFEGGGAAFAD